MSYTALYREWRPQRFEDVVGEEHVTTTLKNQIRLDKIAHAYLLCGTRGTGKTSTAKILAKAINCLNPQNGEPCNECDMCKKISSGLAVDIVELDAASHNSVDNIRDIIDEVQYAPREAKYKVYIIDEVHMLSMGAVNAFLKTLEEPPANVVFILATTDPQKLPITILSRCQRFDFKRIKSEEISKRLRKIVDEKNISADDNSLNLIARMCDGAMRDALSLLDQVISLDSKVKYDKVIDILGLVTNENMLKLVDNIIYKNIDKAILNIDDIVFSGKDIYIVIKELIGHMRNLMIVKVTNNPEEVIDMSVENISYLKEQAGKLQVEDIMRYIRILQEAEEQCRLSKQSRIFLELAIIKMIKVEYDTSKEVIVSRINNIERLIKEGKISVNLRDDLNSLEESTKSIGNDQFNKLNSNGSNGVKVESTRENNFSEVGENSNPSMGASNLTLDKVKSAWKDILDLIKSRREMIIYASLTTGILTSCKDGNIVISYTSEYAFNKKRLDNIDIQKKVNAIVSEVLKQPVNVHYVIEQEQTKKTKEEIIRESVGNVKFEVFE
ncbi:DNA polymerase-3 subunit gamma/tau [Hathewaya proteolytica DSM 3090]|uniref:DNA-directed DNA polymerase n=1 Tax=Hathewaya proteolytica DSM 3090 TaxID=1121331 RepID=A0A1M6SBX5_9CLOT|nr:DNA polymerase III subunit gamma/tau [Hathewaya proteolytica]SHK42176.1 DNA polymerase-3 subunit gamma/tau [Hathewaya proteolytica DSM 3090]